MAKKKVKETVEKTYEEGDRAPGEDAPVDDSHIGTDLPLDEAENEEPAQVADDLEEVLIDGVRYMLPADVAASYRSQEERTADELASLRANPPLAEPISGSVITEDESEDIETLLFTDPKRALDLHAERVKKEVSSDMRDRYQAERAREMFWEDFYGEHPELVDEKDYVDFTLNKHLDGLSNLKGKKARDELAKLVKGGILKLMNKGRNAQNNEEGESSLEGGSGGSSNFPSPDGTPQGLETGRLYSLSDALKERKKKRLQKNREAS
jgi:hypothetical protein